VPKYNGAYTDADVRYIVRRDRPAQLGRREPMTRVTISRSATRLEGSRERTLVSERRKPTSCTWGVTV